MTGSATATAEVFAYAAGGAAPAVTIVTEADGSTASQLAATGRSLLAQSLQAWEWTIVTRDAIEPPVDDPRVRIVEAPVRAAALTHLLESAAPFVALVEPGESLAPTSLEKWAWFLDAHPEARGVTGVTGAVSGLLVRRDDAQAAGGLDAAYVAVTETMPPRRVANTGGSDAEHADEAPLGLELMPANAWLREDAAFDNPLPTQRPRLLLLAPWMSPGGADRVNLNLLDHLVAAGWEVTVATTLVGDHSLYAEYARRTPDLFPLAHFLPLVDYPRFLAYLLESRRPDVVLVANSELGYRLLPYLRAARPATALVDYCHSETEDWYCGGYPRLSVEYRESLDLTLTASRHLRAWMIARGADSGRVEVCYANVDVDTLRPLPGRRGAERTRRGLHDSDDMILFVGRISAEKGPRVLVETAAALAARELPFRLLVAGDGPELRWLRNAVRRRGLSDNVSVLGEVPTDDVAALYEAADVVFLPSRVEGIALTLYEAMALGRPVVAADIGGQAELVTPETGILVGPAAGAEAYANALASLLRDPDRRAAIGDAARRRVQTSFRSEQFGEQAIELFDRARSLSRAAPRPAPTRLAARAQATEAIELTRIQQAVFPTWRGRPTWRRPQVRHELFYVMQRTGRPLYLRAVATGKVPWLPQLRDAVRRVLIGE